jgi:hypothetical protein
MSDDSGLPVQLITLGVALVAFGLGCHFWSDRVYRTAGLAIGAAQLCRCFLHRRIGGRESIATSENRSKWMKLCDHLTAVLLVMAFMHAMATASG